MAGQPSVGQYRAQLRRAINILGNVAISVSGITPTASVFVIAPSPSWPRPSSTPCLRPRPDGITAHRLDPDRLLAALKTT